MFLITGTHLGAEKTADGITAKFHWNGIYKFIKDYIRQCPVCIERHPKMLASSLQMEVDEIPDTGDSDDGIVENVSVVPDVQIVESPNVSIVSPTLVCEAQKCRTFIVILML